MSQVYGGQGVEGSGLKENCIPIDSYIWLLGPQVARDNKDHPEGFGWEKEEG